MTSQESLDSLEAEIQMEEIEEYIIHFPEIVYIGADTVYIASEEVRGRVDELIRSIPDGKDFLKTVKIKSL